MSLQEELADEVRRHAVKASEQHGWSQQVSDRDLRVLAVWEALVELFAGELTPVQVGLLNILVKHLPEMR